MMWISKRFLLVCVIFIWCFLDKVHIVLSRINTESLRCGSSETCISIHECPPLLNLLREQGRNPQVAASLRQKHCDTVHGTAKVCCPSSTSSSEPLPSVSDKRSKNASCPLPEMCVTIDNCPSILNLFQNQGRDPEVAASLRKIHCGDEQKTPKVCCPHSLSALPEDFSLCGETYFTRPKINSPFDSSIGDWPWMAALNHGPSNNSVPNFKCTATLISRQWLIMAAHCVQFIDNVKNAFVRLGVVNLDSRVNNSGVPVDVPVDQVITHPEYSTNPLANDIALVQLKYSLYYSVHIHPICLLSSPEFKENKYYLRKQPFVIGWGAANYRRTSFNKLQDSLILSVDTSKCEQQYEDKKSVIIDEKVICAGEPGKDNCQMDPGAALVFPNSTEVRFKLGGIASYGTGEKLCSLSRPGVYTRIAHFVDWINQVTGIKF